MEYSTVILHTVIKNILMSTLGTVRPIGKRGKKITKHALTLGQNTTIRKRKNMIFPAIPVPWLWTMIILTVASVQKRKRARMNILVLF